MSTLDPWTHSITLGAIYGGVPKTLVNTSLFSKNWANPKSIALSAKPLSNKF